MGVIVLRGDARQIPLPDASVDLICCSPPYFGQRDYRDNGESMAGQIGAEATPREYIAALLDCTREWMRVLKPSGSIFVNLGDKFSQRTQVRRSSHQPSMHPGQFPEFTQSWAERARQGAVRMPHQNVVSDEGASIAEKSLMLLPARYLIACADELGLIVRRDIIWSKPSGMPESVTDRCASKHEYIFHLVKQPRYFAAIDEIREPHAEVSLKRAMPHRAQPGRRPAVIYNGQPEQTLDLAQMNHPLGKIPASVWSISPAPFTPPAWLGVEHFATFPPELPRRIILGWSPSGICTSCGEGRFPVAVPTGEEGRHPGGGGTYRAMRKPGERNTNLADAALKVRSIIGYACACTPYTSHPGTGETRPAVPEHWAGGPVSGGGFAKQARDAVKTGPWREYHLEDWTPAPARPAVVLDPFGGSGVTALVADVLGRTGISLDRSASYCRLARWRTTDPGERARAMQVPKPPVEADGQLDMFSGEAS